MGQGWGSYFTQFDNKPASVALDLDAGSESQRQQRPYLCQVNVRLLAPTADGWPSKQEFAQLNELEDQLTAGLERANDGQFVGRCTHDGMRMFFYYLANQTGADSVLQNIFQQFPAYRWNHNLSEDAVWDAYTDFLSPGEEEMQALQNQNVLQTLMENGDTLSTPRRVDHWLYFPSIEALQHCKAAVLDLTYKVESESDDDGKWCLQIYREDSVEPAVIDATTIELFRLAKEAGGEYDGWETFVVKK